MTSYCKVHGCRFSDTHITMFHKCGSCGRFGHGNWECNHYEARIYLESQFKTTELIPINDRCQIYNCRLPWTHKNEAHYCSKCNERGIEHLEDCPTSTIIDNTSSINNTKIIKCPSCNVENSTVDLTKQYSVDGECVICYSKKQMVLIEPCNHVTVCVECVKSL